MPLRTNPPAASAVILVLSTFSWQVAAGEIESSKVGRSSEVATLSTAVGEVQVPSDKIAAYPLDCANDNFEFATSLGQLPAGMRAVLSEGGAVADREEDFNSTDAMRETLPSDHFAGAAVGHRRIFAVVQHGGTGLINDYWAFERNGSRWVGNHRWYGVTPTTLQDILSVACKQYVKLRHMNVAGLRMDCSFGQSRLTTLRYEGAGRRGNFELRPRNRIEWLFSPDGITDAETNSTASSRQRAELRAVLKAARPAMNWEDDCRYAVDIFQRALGSTASEIRSR